MSFNYYTEGHAQTARGIHIVTVSIPAIDFGEFARAFGQVGDELHSYVAHWSPRAAARDMAALLFTNIHGPAPTPLQRQLAEYGLPKYPRRWHPAGWHIPDRIDWLNYWSADTCAALGYRGNRDDRELFANAAQREGGAWLLQLTDEPLDLSIEAHRARLKRAFDRFPAIWK